MKKAVLVLMAAVSVMAVSCGGQTAKKNKSKNEENMKTIQLTTKDFATKVADLEATGGEWKYLGDKPAIIDFYADWCGPCKMIAPILDELAEEYGDQIYIYKVDTEKERDLSAAFGIRSIPTLIFIPMDAEPQVARGAMPKESLKEAVDQILLNKKAE